MKTYDYINRVVITLPLSVYEGTWTALSPLVAMHHQDGSCVCVGFFLKLLHSPTRINSINVNCANDMQNYKLGDDEFFMSTTYCNDHDWGDASYDTENLFKPHDEYDINESLKAIKISMDECNERTARMRAKRDWFVKVCSSSFVKIMMKILK